MTAVNFLEIAMKRIFILNGHPAADSLSRALAQTYRDAASAAGHEVRMVHIHDLAFDSDFGFAGFKQIKPLEPSLTAVLDDIEWSNHIVLTTPMWWGGLPAKLKGLIDRSLLPGRAFDTRNTNNGMPLPMLGGRSARVIVTSDTPGWFMRLVYGNAIFGQLRGQIFGLVGIKPTRFTHFSGASDSTPRTTSKWLDQVRKMGAAAA